MSDREVTTFRYDLNGSLQDWVIGEVLRRQAMERPEAPFLQWQLEEPVTYAEVYEQSTRVAAWLRQFGVTKGDPVLIMLPNSLEFLYTWFGANLLAAVEVPLNIHYKGTFLSHEVTDSEARVAVVHRDYLERFEGVASELTHLRHMVVVGGDGAVPSISGWSWHRFADLQLSPPADPVPANYWDVAGILYTSGTTGKSKGVRVRYGGLGIYAKGVLSVAKLTEKDVSYVCLPLFHGNAQFMQIVPTMVAGGRVSIWPTFSASQWLNQIRQCGGTVTNTLGVMCEFIYRQPPRPDDADNPLRVVIALPTPADIGRQFEERFGVTCIEGYGMTEITVVTYRRPDEPLRPGSAGRPLTQWWDVQVVDPETDEPVGPNQVGEIVVRPKLPGVLNAGYHRSPEKTVEAWRNLWFHTGDSGKIDAEGYLYFVDRLKDYIRRRGENISSAMLEAVVNQHSAVLESAAIAVRSEHGAAGEEEVKICVVLKQGCQLTPNELLNFCQPRMPYFAVPRYVEFMDELPKTANSKVRKFVLRQTGLTPTTWDALAAGHVISQKATNSIRTHG